MMTYKTLLLSLFIGLLTSCGSSERVILDDGSIYEVKGNIIKSDGKDVSESLSRERRDEVEDALKEKIAARKAAEERQKALEDEQAELRKIQKEARKKEKELEKKQEQLEDKRKALKEAKDNYGKAKNKLKKERKAYKKLKENGKLNASEQEDWIKKIEDLETEVKKAKETLDKLR
ncbi:hypothetical protein [uncultured Psychroserpens sp.]|uniref:hypothetical protein n=1 Tax=uncultured Psychroserpens sp. TaxID=255436 RepID=UPI0026175974|nr:hypothetical protein [uncultured Psychroserpens sp.]